MLSVIIPTYNRLALLKITLEAIFRQTHPADEIIVVDDHSQDGTFEYLISHPNHRLRVLKTQGKGPGAARNTGLRAAKGNYIKFFDSDDLLTRNTFEVQLRYLQQTGAPMVYSPYVHFFEENEKMTQKDVILQYFPIPENKTLSQCMAMGFFTIIPAMMFTADFLQKIGEWRTDLYAYEDWDYLWRIAQHIDNPAHTNECLTFYRIHGQQTTESNFSNTRRDEDKINCLKKAIAEEKKSTKKLFLNSELYKTRKKIHPKTEVNFILEIFLLFKRIRNKFERIRTKTNWETMHGPEKKSTVFDHYLQML